MSIDLNWETVTGGPDGQELADQIRDFIHTKFQSVPLPRFIKSVTVHDFQFGAIPPEVELKDITDPLPDFYEDHVDSDLASDDSEGEDDAADSVAPVQDERRRRPADSEILGGGARNFGHLPPHLMFGGPGGPGVGSLRNGDLGSPFMRVPTPGIPGGTSNLHYFHSHLASGLSGTQTPLAAVAGAHHLSTVNWLEGHGHSSSVPNLPQYANFGGVDTSRRYPEPSHSRNPSQSSISIADFSPTGNLAPPPTNLSLPSLREKHSVSTLAPTSAGASRPPTRDAAATLMMGSAIADDTDDPNNNNNTTDPTTTTTTTNKTEQQQHQQQQQQENEPRLRERRIDDMQAVFRIRYAGDVKLLLTADILLDYPMPSFVGIPVRLSITGLTFDGVGVLAKIRKRVHFCFLSPEDAVAAVGDEEGGGGLSSSSSPESTRQTGQGQQQQQQQGGRAGSGGAGSTTTTTKLGGLLQEIRVESEIGQRESGKQSLKNVGKVERFVLEQVRRIFEEEFVYPSFWTFLV
ncbi:hypothetical protein C8A01DRAFT_33745 [Parachaetomium inaequale]|uniref:Mitochondrial distribution and morphology protein 12 n=1 Tax=Parachaetomium inaequale TaxID=2588326 RepID=A0AAN6SU08_9PEZI|nr:hypothetical protein C8A01DRAFT_33745 [Parachaetomium inaequale]